MDASTSAVMTQDENLFRNLMDGAAIALVVTRDDHFLFANEFANELYGLAGKSLVGRCTFDFHPDRECHAEFQKLLRKHDRVKNYSLKLRTDDGQSKTILYTTTKGYYDGKPAFYSVLQDFTELAQSHAKFERQEEQHKRILELMPDAVLVQAKGKILYSNQMAVQLFRATHKNDLIGQASISLVVPEMRDEAYNLRRRVEEQDLATHLDMRHLRLDNTDFPTRLYMQPVNWDGEKGTLLIIRDMSKAQENLEKLHRKDQEMEMAQEMGQTGHWRIEFPSLNVTWSRTIYKIHGLDPETTSLDIDLAKSLVIPEDRANMIDAINNTLRKREPHNYEVRLMTPSGELRSMMGSVLPEFDESGEVNSVFGFAQNVTAQRDLEEKLRQSQKMEAVGQLTGGIAHDFNNLLAVIQGNAELLLEPDTVPEASRERMLQAIVSASERGADLTRNMLAFAREQRLRPIVATLSNSVNSSIAMLRRTIEEEIDINVEITPYPWSCQVDPGQLENALINLVLNARDATPKGGRIDVSLENHHQQATQQILGEEIPEGDYVVLTVSDTGSGIPPNKIKHVFDPFFTTKEVGKGTGLGLSMVYGFIKQSSGYVAIHSKEDVGTKVAAYFPRVLED